MIGKIPLTPHGEAAIQAAADLCGIPAATLSALRSGEMVAIPHHKHMTDEMAEVIAMQAGVCGGIAYDLYRAIIEHQLAAAVEAEGE